MLRTYIIIGLTASVLVSAGCRHCCGKRVFGRSPAAPPPGNFLGSPVVPENPSLGGATIPPPNVPTTPSSPPPGFPGPSESLRTDPAYPPPPLTPPDFPPTDLPPVNRSFPPPSSVPSPRGSSPELLLPDPLPPRSSEFGPAPTTVPGLDAPIRPLEVGEPPVSIPLPTSGSDRPPPPVSTAPARSRTPVGLGEYQAVVGQPGVFTGRRPSLDGFDWLKANQFRTILYLHGPAVDARPARDLAETRGLAFESLAVDPASLSAAVDRFNEAVSARLYRPLYVADDDGNRAGMLWYLYFRTVELLGDDAARVRASGLGLPSTDTEVGKQYWIAAQKYLASQ